MAIEPEMGESVDSSGRHFSGVYSQTAIEVVRAVGGDDLVTRVLARAGEARSATDLERDGTWSSYGQLRRLLEAAAGEMGGAERLGSSVGSTDNQPVVIISTTETLQSLGSPNTMLAALAASDSSPVSSITVGGYEQVAETTWLITGRLADGYEAFPELCHLGMRMMAMVPRMFGFSDVTTREVACQCAGDPNCVMELRWEERDELHRRLTFVTSRAQVLEARLTSLQNTVAGMVSDEDLDVVLDRVVRSAAAAVGAPGFVLALDDVRGTARSVYHSDGIEAPRAEAVARRLRAHRDAGEGVGLVAPVRSRRCHYGFLAGVDHDDSPFLEQERTMLESYAKLAATALDVATALDSSRRETATARALLQLAGSLAEVTTTDEMAVRLARAISQVIDCDRAVVVLAEPTTDLLRVAATAGYDAEVDRELRAIRLSKSDAPEHAAGLEFQNASDDLPWIRDLMTSTGSVTRASVPISLEGEYLGYVIVTVTEDPERLRGDVHLAERLQGLAAQAATALRNASLHDQIQHQALHDALTGMPNRVLVLDRAEQLLARCRRAGRLAGVLFVDLDGFKDVNDTFGHGAGDELLKAVGARLQTAMRATDTVGRLGGDEFVVLVDGGDADADSEVVAHRLLAVLSEPVRLEHAGGVDVAMTASIGIAVGLPSTAGELLKDADIALYSAKTSGKNRVALFRPEMQTEILDRNRLLTDLRTAAREGQFLLEYQPILGLDDGAATGVEALLRWEHPSQGRIYPDRFIPALEESGMIVEVGRWVLRQACSQAAAWARRGLHLDISVNVSPRQLESDEFVDHVTAALAESRLDPARLILELTETTIMNDPVIAAARVQEIKQAGVRIAVDDFGIGYSSLGLLQQFSLDVIKIDRSFTAGMVNSAEGAALMRTLVQLGKSLGLATLAEGIEDFDQLQALVEEGCDSGQGFLFARPMAPDAVLAFIAQSPRSRSQHNQFIPAG